MPRNMSIAGTRALARGAGAEGVEGAIDAGAAPDMGPHSYTRVPTETMVPPRGGRVVLSSRERGALNVDTREHFRSSKRLALGGGDLDRRSRGAARRAGERGAGGDRVTRRGRPR